MLLLLKLKEFADDKLNKAQMMEIFSLIHKVGNVMGKGKN